MPLYLRLALLLPTFAAFGASPLLFDRASQPFWIYLFSGVVTWWSAHKVAAAALGRGPLIHATSAGAFTTMALFPAAFFHVAPSAPLPMAAAVSEPTVTAAGEAAAAAVPHVAESESESARNWAARFQPVHEPAWKPFVRTVAKVASAAAAAAAVIHLRSRRLAAAGWSLTAAGAASGSPTSLWHVLAPAPAPFESATTVLEHLAFMWIIYTSFSSVMDGPLALLQAARFTERPGAGEGVSILPHFDVPWMSASLRELWTRRWNISAGSILRQLVYEPLVDVGSKAGPLALQPPLDAHRDSHDESEKLSTTTGLGGNGAALESPAAAAGGASASGLGARVLHGQREAELRHRRPIGAATPSAAVLSIAPTPSGVHGSLSAAASAAASAGEATGIASGSSQRGTATGSLRASAWLRTFASLATFAVSGLCHEMIIAYCA